MPIDKTKVVWDEPEQIDPQQVQWEGENVSFGEFIEPIATVGSAALAEPIAGIAGIVQSVNPFAEPGAGTRAVEATREALTYRPRTAKGQQVLSEFGGVVAPAGQFMGKAERALGDTVYDLTGSATLAAGSASLPAAAMELFALKGARGAVKGGRSIKSAVKDYPVNKALQHAAPEISQLKDASRQLYREIDELGASIKPKSFSFLSGKIRRVAQKMGARPKSNPEVYAILDELDDLTTGEGVKTFDIEGLREVAQSVAGVTGNNKTAAVGVAVIDEIDDFLDKLGPKGFSTTSGQQVANVGKKYRHARSLWGRARKAEVVREIFEKAHNQATGFENGLRTQFRQILNNKKRSRFFNEQELSAMRDVVRGTSTSNTAKALGKFGFSEGQASNMLLGSLGTAGGFAFGGGPGALLMAGGGQFSKNLAQRLTANKARFADQVIRAGKNGRRIVEAYLKNTPRKQRNAAELSELLLSGDIDIGNLPDIPIANEAKKLAVEQAAQLGAALAVGAGQGLSQQ